MKISTRINGRVTSISVKDSVLALHYIVNGADTTAPDTHALDTCHNIMSRWKGDTGKGASSFIIDAIMEDLLEPCDLPAYHSTLEKLTNG